MPLAGRAAPRAAGGAISRAARPTLAPRRPARRAAPPRGATSRRRRPSRVSARAPGGGDSGGSGDGGGAAGGGGAAPDAGLAAAYQALGLAEGSPYEAVVAAKNRLLADLEEPAQRDAVEAAYDAIFSRTLAARLSGATPVDTRVRFADVARAPPRGKGGDGRGSRGGGGGGGGRGKAAAAPGGLALAARALPPATAAQAAAVFGGLAAWTLAQGLLAPSPGAAAADVPGLQLALGCGAAVYFLRTKGASLPKALGLAAAALVAASLAGGALESWLRVDLVPVGGLRSPGAVVGECAVAGLWAAAAFLA